MDDFQKSREMENIWKINRSANEKNGQPGAAAANKFDSGIQD